MKQSFFYILLSKALGTRTVTRKEDLLWGYLCAHHALDKKAEYEKMGRQVELID